jgi:hypothetical protein
MPSGGVSRRPSSIFTFKDNEKVGRGSEVAGVI